MTLGVMHHALSGRSIPVAAIPKRERMHRQNVVLRHDAAAEERPPIGWRSQMPVILWLLGVPLVVVIALMVMHVI
jgi:hypothetical protein